MSGWRKRTIMKMAREAGFNLEQGFLLRVTGIDEDLERFEALVREDEREECAKWYEDKGWLLDESDVATAIRARGQA